MTAETHEPDRSDGLGRSDGSAYAAALSGLPGMGPATLVRLLARMDPVSAWAEVRAGRVTRPVPGRVTPGEASSPDSPGGDQIPLWGPGGSGARADLALEGGAGRGANRSGRSPGTPWIAVAARVDPVRWWEPYRQRGVGVTWPGRPDYPAALRHDPAPPGVLFWRGRLDCLDAPRVAIVGTRNATPDGRSVAFEMGRELTEAGVCVLSGLALGIDGAAHSGAVSALRCGPGAGPVGVAASGVDVPYPRRHADLWEEVVRTGAVLSETLPGRPAQAWRFPTRNRVIAGLADLVVVVESHERGGSLITAEAAIERGVEVRVVPGPVHSPASAGSNQLLYDGPGPVRHARDVLDALGLIRPDDRPERWSTGGRPGPARQKPAGPGPERPAGPRCREEPAGSGCGEEAVLAAMGWRPANVGQIMARSGMGAPEVLRTLEALEVTGRVSAEAGWWARRS